MGQVQENKNNGLDRSQIYLRLFIAVNTYVP